MRTSRRAQENWENILSVRNLSKKTWNCLGKNQIYNHRSYLLDSTFTCKSLAFFYPLTWQILNYIIVNSYGSFLLFEI